MAQASLYNHPANVTSEHGDKCVCCGDCVARNVTIDEQHLIAGRHLSMVPCQCTVCAFHRLNPCVYCRPTNHRNCHCDACISERVQKEGVLKRNRPEDEAEPEPEAEAEAEAEPEAEPVPVDEPLPEKPEHTDDSMNLTYYRLGKFAGDRRLQSKFRDQFVEFPVGLWVSRLVVYNHRPTGWMWLRVDRDEATGAVRCELKFIAIGAKEPIVKLAQSANELRKHFRKLTKQLLEMKLSSHVTAKKSIQEYFDVISVWEAHQKLEAENEPETKRAKSVEPEAEEVEVEPEAEAGPIQGIEEPALVETMEK